MGSKTNAVGIVKQRISGDAGGLLVSLAEAAVDDNKLAVRPYRVQMCIRDSSTTERMSPPPPLGMSTSKYAFNRIRAVAVSLEVSSTSATQSSGSPAPASASRMTLVTALLDSKASLPPRRMTALPAFKQRAAASEVTLGRAS